MKRLLDCKLEVSRSVVEIKALSEHDARKISEPFKCRKISEFSDTCSKMPLCFADKKERRNFVKLHELEVC